jgi:kinesin family protein 1
MTSVKVAVRVRPFNQREKGFQSECIIEMVGNQTKIRNPVIFENFNFLIGYWQSKRICI